MTKPIELRYKLFYGQIMESIDFIEFYPKKVLPYYPPKKYLFCRNIKFLYVMNFYDLFPKKVTKKTNRIQDKNYF